jgi:DNA-binding CsgD family transcriptional regulator
MAREADKALWAYDGWRVTARQVQLARDAGALDRLPLLLNQIALDAVYGGDLAAATSLIAEADTICEATGARVAPYAATMLASFRGRETEAAPLIQSAIEQAEAGGQGAAVTWGYRVAAILCNGLCRHEEALAAARQASEHAHVYVSMSTLPELIEAATRTGSTRIASDALDQLAMRTRAGGTEDGLGILARSRALLSEGEEAEGYHRDAISRLGRTRRRPELARATCCTANGCAGSGTAAKPVTSSVPPSRCSTRWEWRRSRPGPGPGPGAAGERARPRSPGTPAVLSAQEAQIGRMVAEHLSNREIAAWLFISASTVEYHLRKIFRKLGISSRGQLARTLQDHTETPGWQG